MATLVTYSTAAHAQPAGGAAVSFTTPDDSGGSLTLRGMLWTPPEPPRGAVVLVHGSGGWSDFKEGHYGRALSAAGYAVLAIDTFGPRGFSQTTENQALLSFHQMARDAFSARRFLLERGFAPERIAVMGFSKGGAAALHAADRTFLPDEADRFAVAIAFYPPCHVRPRSPKPASSMLMALGEKDDLTGVKPCQDIADAFANAGGKVSVKIYPNSSHAFDGDPANTRMFTARFAEQFLNCLVVIEADGRGSYGGKSYVNADDPTLMEDMRKTCVGKGASFWTNTRQKDAATRDAVEFLNSAFPARPR